MGMSHKLSYTLSPESNTGHSVTPLMGHTHWVIGKSLTGVSVDKILDKIETKRVTEYC